LDFIELPVVGEVPGVEELAAGSPVVEPRPLGPPALCPRARVLEHTSADAIAIVVSFIVPILRIIDETNR
jgi:hypothetical protein